jgi:hypothetical protein
MPALFQSSGSFFLELVSTRPPYLRFLLAFRASTTPPAVTSRPAASGIATMVTEFEQECVQFFAEVVQIFGVPKSVGQIYGILYASPYPLGFSDIVERLEISKGSASQGLGLLRSLGAIVEAEGDELNAKTLLVADNKSTMPRDGVRRVVYEPELSLRRLVSGVLRERIAPIAAVGVERLERLRQLAERDPGATTFYLDRAKQLNTWRRRLKTVLPVLAALLGPKSRR